VDPANMSDAQKELLRKAKTELVTKDIIISPSIIGGSLV
jgi:hypothetical protein